MVDQPFQPLTVFGATVLELMARRGIMDWSALSRLLAEHGYHFTQARMSNWAYGRHAAPSAFPVALKEVLQLDDEEETLLARAFTYGQDERITSAWLEE
jgi:hypothetical protein